MWKFGSFLPVLLPFLFSETQVPKKPEKRPTAGVPELISVGNLLFRLVELFRREETVDVLTFVEAIQFFSRHRPADARVAKGAILRSRDRQGTLIFQVFLDAGGQPLFDLPGGARGRKVRVRMMDEELEEAFDGSDLIVVE
ncbi:MAG: hypothetical protein GX442_21270 [Candidatus Riflebacteria bacterium]|nr:hypothetical protein [Candidatus Riflebacteria bacterium]